MLIYHFTTLKTLEYILNSKLLKFSKLEHSNDPLEHLYSKQLIDKFVKQLYPTNYQNILTHFHMNVSNNNDLYLDGICFSKKLNNVHNWMEYGDHGYGVALGFDYDKLKEIFKENNLSEYIDLYNVIYSRASVLRKIGEIASLSTNPIEAGRQLGRLYKYIKQPSYFVEYECRIIHLPSKYTDEFNESNIFSKSVFFKDETFNSYGLNLEILYEKGVFKKIVFGCNVKKYVSEIFKKQTSVNFMNIKYEYSKVIVNKKEEKYDD